MGQMEMDTNMGNNRPSLRGIPPVCQRKGKVFTCKSHNIPVKKQKIVLHKNRLETIAARNNANENTKSPNLGDIFIVMATIHC